eukprot:1095106-Pelagomonas_calceolata.AAC.1
MPKARARNSIPLYKMVSCPFLLSSPSLFYSVTKLILFGGTGRSEDIIKDFESQCHMHAVVGREGYGSKRAASPSKAPANWGCLAGQCTQQSCLRRAHQVDGRVFLCRPTKQGAWGVEGPLEGGPNSPPCSITAAAPSLLLPEQNTRPLRLCESNKGGSSEPKIGGQAAAGSPLSIRAWIRAPQGATLLGWHPQQDEHNTEGHRCGSCSSCHAGQSDADLCAGGGGGDHSEDGPARVLHVLACTSTLYLPTQLGAVTQHIDSNDDQSSSLADADGMEVYEVRRGTVRHLCVCCQVREPLAHAAQHIPQH